MLYLTDLDYDSTVGHNIAEVEVYGSGKCIGFCRNVSGGGKMTTIF